jgi:hypothetical protein
MNEGGGATAPLTNYAAGDSLGGLGAGGGITWSADGAVFPGFTGGFSTGATPAPRYSPSSFTLLARCKLDATGMATSRNIFRMDQGSNRRIVFRIETGNVLRGIVFYTTTNADATGATALAANVWYDFAITFDGPSQTCKCYVNGVQDGSGAGTGTLWQGAAVPPLFLGSSSTPSEWFVGKLSYVYQYNRVLTPLEIRAVQAAPWDLFAPPSWYKYAFRRYANYTQTAAAGISWGSHAASAYNAGPAPAAGISWGGHAFNGKNSPCAAAAGITWGGHGTPALVPWNPPRITYQPVPLVFELVAAGDHATPWSGTPTVEIRKIGGSWQTPAGAVLSRGAGVFVVAGHALDQDTTGPLYLYATGAGADPCWRLYWVGDIPGYIAGRCSWPFPFVLTDTAAPYNPLLGASGITVQVGRPEVGNMGTPSAVSFVTEAGHGFYEWTASVTDVATAGLLELRATAAGATGDWETYLLDAGPAPPGPRASLPDPERASSVAYAGLPDPERATS